MQTEAIKNLKWDKVTVWENGGEGKSATANFVSGLYKAVPPLKDMFDMAGMGLQEYLGKKVKNVKKEEEEKEKGIGVVGVGPYCSLGLLITMS